MFKSYNIFQSASRAFFGGMGSVLDLSGGIRVLDRHRSSDAEAIYGDWKAVGDDIRKASQTAEKDLKREESRQLSLALD